MFMAQTARQNRSDGCPPSDDGGHVCLVASIVRSGSVGVLRVLAAEPPSDDGGQIEPSGPGIPVCAQVMGQRTGRNA
jgi:hypothetical protein